MTEGTDPSAWKDLLARWSKDLLADPSIAEDLPPDVVASGWLGYPPASEEQIRATEDRLGTMLPPSYRAFLKTSNGWRNTTSFIDRLWSTDEIDWFRVRNRDWIEAWTEGKRLAEQQYGAVEIPDEEYFVYGEDQNAFDLRREYLKTALEISDTGDSGIYLLNPRVVTADGEWEAWFFANWLPGAVRYRSFWDMMQGEYRSYLDERE
ncbi:MAG TPA: SMI1/KNR4 family protein [Chloroflexota bacterium]|nr:SMI1/KNR4 family protein [Chloroflexota bacterium]